MNKPMLSPSSVEITRGPLPGSRKIRVDGVPFREVALSGASPPESATSRNGTPSTRIFREPGSGPRVISTDDGLSIGLFILDLSLRRYEPDQVQRDLGRIPHSQLRPERPWDVCDLVLAPRQV